MGNGKSSAVKEWDDIELEERKGEEKPTKQTHQKTKMVVDPTGIRNQIFVASTCTCNIRSNIHETCVESFLTSRLLSEAACLRLLEPNVWHGILLHILAPHVPYLPYMLMEQHVCRSGFIWLTGISASTLDRYQGMAVRGVVEPPSHGTLGKHVLQAKKNGAINWILMYSRNGDFNPTTGKIHLPSLLDSTALHAQYLAEISPSVPENLRLQLSAWTELFRKGSKVPGADRIKHIKFKRPHNLKECDECAASRLERVAMVYAGLTRDSPQWKEHDARKNYHLALVMRGRVRYSAIRAFALANPQLLTSIIVDGSHAPLMPSRSFDTATGRLIPQIATLFFGLLSHGGYRGPWGTIYISGSPGYQHGKDEDHFTWKPANTAIQVTFEELRKLHLANELAPRLHVQVDGGERSVSLIAMLALVLHLGWVTHVTIDSLFPGHTHEDIDALFSAYWKAFKKLKVKPTTYQEIEALFRSVYCNMDKVGKRGPISVVEMTTVFDWTAWFKRHLVADTVHGLKGFAGDAQERKPHRVELELVGGAVVLSAYESVDPKCEAPTNCLKYRERVFRSTPLVSDLKEIDLLTGFGVERDALVAALKKYPAFHGGVSPANIERIKAQTLGPRRQEFGDILCLGGRLLSFDRIALPAADVAQYVPRPASEEDEDETEPPRVVLRVVESILERGEDLDGSRVAFYLVKYVDVVEPEWEFSTSIENTEAIKVFEAERTAGMRFRDVQSVASTLAVRRSRSPSPAVRGPVQGDIPTPQQGPAVKAKSARKKK